MTERHVIFITSPLEAEHAERMRNVDPGRVEVIHEPDLLPPTRYVADHNGPPDFQPTPDQRQRFNSNLRRAEILWDFPAGAYSVEDLFEAAPKLRWVQTTSSGVGQAVARMGLQDSDLLITTARGIHAGPLAEYVFMVLLNQVKHLNLIRRGQKART
ncbi:MAG: D-2-hydroxyacid dehydrogenase, partial [Chloroflexota bacterium]